MEHAVQISFINFLLVYLLLIVISIIMKVAKINQMKLLIVGGLRMTVQLTLAGYILMYLLDNPSPVLVALYWLCMAIFAIHRILSINKGLNKKFRLVIGGAVIGCAGLIVSFFVVVVINQNLFDAQYTIPISGMILGNTMTGISLGVKTFMAKIKDSKLQIDTLLHQGATPKSILLPMVNASLETALLPTINTMVGMGIVSLPGMMTGQILSGELPSTAIMYQISVTICISAVVCLSVFLALHLGYKTLYNENNQFTV